MPQQIDIKRKLTSRSDRVKSVELHPTEPWMLISLYNGSVMVLNHETQIIVKKFEISELPVRVARFVTRKNWIVAGADDNQIRVVNYNTFARVHMFEAHADYIRTIVVHPTQPYILSGSDDMLIKLWDWDRKWACCQVFEGHNHYIMQVVINPKDNNQFASASLDRTVKVWQLGTSTPNFTLEGHGKGVNCVDYYSGGDKPYLISGADDYLVKIWDYQNKTCVQTLEGHTRNVTCVSFHPELPFILTGAEDGTVRVWHSNTYRLENTLIYGMERVWCVCGQPGSNNVALGYDEGSILIKLGREEPAMSMDSSGKILWARHSEVQLANLKTMGEFEIKDGESLPLGVKDMGSCEIYPQTLMHSPNGRFVTVCGDGEYIIYTAMALRNKSFGSAQEFVWAYDSSQYAIKDGNGTVKIFRNFKEKKAFKPHLGAEGIFGGFLLGVKSNNSLVFYDWESGDLVRRIEIQPKHIFWSVSGELVCIAADESFFVLRYLSEKMSTALESKEGMTDDGLEDAFEVLGDVPDRVNTGVWVGDCFIYTNSVKRLNYNVGGEIITIAHLDRVMYLLGYIPSDNRLYLGDKNLNIVSYYLLLSVLEYQTAVMRRDFSYATKILPSIPKEQRTRVANFLEKQGFREQGLAITTDPEHKFELALQLGQLEIAHVVAEELESDHKWRQLAEQATKKCQFSLAQKCLHKVQDNGGLLLLATASGNTDMVDKVAEQAEKDGETNVAFLAYFMQGRLDKCLDLLIKTERLPEAAFLARTYLPSHVSRVVNLWRESLSTVSKKMADALADPTLYGNLFPDFQQALLAEQYLKEALVGIRPAAEYPLIMPNEDRNVLGECADFVSEERVNESKVESMNENLKAAAATADEPVLHEPASVEKMIYPVSSTEEESVTTANLRLSVTTLQQCVESHQVEFVSSAVAASAPEEEDTSTKLVEEDILEESVIHLEVVQSRPENDVISSGEEDVQGMFPATDAFPAASVSEAGVTKTTENTIIPASETLAVNIVEANSVVVTIEFTADTDALPSEPEEAAEMLVYDELEKGLVSLDVLAPPPLFLQSEPEVVSVAKASAERDASSGDIEDPAGDCEMDAIQQVLDELDLNNLDLHDIETTNFNLDEDLSK